MVRALRDLHGFPDRSSLPVHASGGDVEHGVPMRVDACLGRLGTDVVTIDSDRSNLLKRFQCGIAILGAR